MEFAGAIQIDVQVCRLLQLARFAARTPADCTADTLLGWVTGCGRTTCWDRAFHATIALRRRGLPPTYHHRIVAGMVRHYARRTVKKLMQQNLSHRPLRQHIPASLPSSTAGEMPLVHPLSEMLSRSVAAGSDEPDDRFHSCAACVRRIRLSGSAATISFSRSILAASLPFC